MIHPPTRSKNGQRCLATLVVACWMALGGGCAIQSLYQRPAALPEALPSTPDGQQLLEQVNRNAAAVKQLQSNVRVAMDGLPSVKGTLVLERPKRLRLRVGFLGMTENGIDVGSNDDVFWIWNKSSIGGQTPAIYYAKHRDYANSRLQQSVQLQPQWIIDSLGLIELDPAAIAHGPQLRADGRYEIRTEIFSPRGLMHRITVVDPRYGWVVQQSVYDANQRLVAWANSTKYRYYPEHQASLPQHIALHVYDPSGEEMTLTVQVLSHRLNEWWLDDSIWEMPQPPDVPRIDLTQVAVQPATPTAMPMDRTGDRRPTPWQRPQLRGFELR